MHDKHVNTLQELQSEWYNPYVQWYAAGMPSFNTYNLKQYKQIRMKFRTQEDRAKFIELTGLPVTEKTNAIWFPFKEREANILNRVVEDDDV